MSVKQPWLETWEIDGDGDVRGGNERLLFLHATGSSREALHLTAAAPDMARALSAMLDAFPRATASEDEARARAAARDALDKAGVPLP